MKMFEFPLNFHWVSSYGPNEQYSSIGSDKRRQTIIWTNDG